MKIKTCKKAPDIVSEAFYHLTLSKDLKIKPAHLLLQELPQQQLLQHHL